MSPYFAYFALFIVGKIRLYFALLCPCNDKENAKTNSTDLSLLCLLCPYFAYFAPTMPTMHFTHTLYLGTGHSYELIKYYEFRNISDRTTNYTIPKIFLLLKAEKIALFVKVIFWTSKRFGLFSKLRNILVYKIGENRIRRLI